MEKIIYNNKNINIENFDKILQEIKKESGHREKSIMENCYKITESEKSENHYILKFYSINESCFFKYDVITKKIVG